MRGTRNMDIGEKERGWQHSHGASLMYLPSCLAVITQHRSPTGPGRPQPLLRSRNGDRRSYWDPEKASISARPAAAHPQSSTYICTAPPATRRFND